MGTSEFAEGDLVTTSAFSPGLEGLRGNLVREPEQSRYPWRFVLTRESQAKYHAEEVAAGDVEGLEEDRLAGWLVREDEIRKEED